MYLLLRCEPLADLYDALHHWWETSRTQRGVALAIFIIYLLSMVAIEMNRNGLFPPVLAAVTPTNHFHAISLAFTLILGLELMGLILSLSCSLSRSMGKQLEILALIMLRDAFKELASLPEPVHLVSPEPILRIALAGGAALGIFICIGIYHRLSRSHNYITRPEERMNYVMSKKIMALVLFCIFVAFGLRDAWRFLVTGAGQPFFETIYTVLIFSDIALVLIAQRFMPSFHAVFRNSGFVIATLIMRLSLSSPWPWGALAGVGAACYALALTWATSYFVPERMKSRRVKERTEGSA